jgi:hypothetical protein
MTVCLTVLTIIGKHVTEKQTDQSIDEFSLMKLINLPIQFPIPTKAESYSPN